MKVDMSEGAVTTRLKRVSQLRRLCLSLAAAKIIEDEAKQPEVEDAAAPIQNLQNVNLSERPVATYDNTRTNTKS